MSELNFDFQFITSFGEALASALGYRDKHTHMHSMRVVRLVSEMANRLGIVEEDYRRLVIAAFFHDVGKVGIPDAILMKPGELTESEWGVMKTHSEIGEDIVRKLDTRDSSVLALIVRHHHEWHNGKGYPDGLRGDAIPFLSRIVALADSYDAMVADREYRKGMKHSAAIKMMRSEVGTKFDPEVAAPFFELVERSDSKATP